jgi:hypothetical protein
MLFDTYSKRLPDNCPKCKCRWTYSAYVVLTDYYPMIGLYFGDSIDVTCSNPDCGANYVYKIIKKEGVTANV